MAIFIGLLVFLTAAMDNPFRGEFSVSADAFQDGAGECHEPPRLIQPVDYFRMTEPFLLH